MDGMLHLNKQGNRVTYFAGTCCLIMERKLVLTLFETVFV